MAGLAIRLYWLEMGAAGVPAEWCEIPPPGLSCARVWNCLKTSELLVWNEDEEFV
jgi:hypothetical protein